MPDIEPIVTVTRYDVSCLPADHPDRYLFTVLVEYRGRDKWAVKRHSDCYDIDGNRSYESIPSERTDEWLQRNRHDLATALEIASKIAPALTVNGHSVTGILARSGGRHG